MAHLRSACKMLAELTLTKELPPPDFYPMMRQLYYCGNNLNQIAKKAHALGVIDTQHYEETVEFFRKTVIKITESTIELK